MIAHTKKKSKVKKPRKPRKPNQYGFPNELMNRNVICRPNIVWAIDGSRLAITRDNILNTTHYLIAGVDPSTNNLLFAKVFDSGTDERTFTSAALIKRL